MRPAPCVVSVADHTGWAHLVCVAARGNVPAVIARRRVALIDKGLPTLPYEHETTAMREDEANAVIAGVRRSIAARTSDALRRVLIELAPAHTAVALAIRKPPFDALPATVAAVRTSHRLLCAADGMLYQLAICRAVCERRLASTPYCVNDLDVQQLGLAVFTVMRQIAGSHCPRSEPYARAFWIRAGGATGKRGVHPGPRTAGW